MEKVVRLRKIGRPVSAIHMTQVHEQDSTDSRGTNEVLSAIHGLASQINANSLQSGRQVACKNCSVMHNRYRPDGRPWPYCETCFQKVIASRQAPIKTPRKPVFAQPTVTAAVCQTCKGPVKNNAKGFPWPKSGVKKNSCNYFFFHELFFFHGENFPTEKKFLEKKFFLRPF